MPSGQRCLFLTGVLLLFPAPSNAGDWPSWRHDASRSAASPDPLPARLHLQWVRRLPTLEPAWPDQPKLQVDDVYEPVALGKRMFVGSSVFDTVTAYETRTGKETWRFQAEGPVRYPPAAWEDRVYFTSDDGYLYCLDAGKGTLLWKFRGGPSDRRILGNGRLISTWPARGAPVLADGTVYFAAGIWPFMGVFVHALDARTGKVIWTNDGDSCIYIKQPHNTDSFAGVAPQGALVVSGDRLIVPGGRSVPAVLDRKTGKLLYFRLGENSKRGGGAAVSATAKVFFNGGAAFETGAGAYLGRMAGQLVLGEQTFYAADSDGIRAFDLANATVKKSTSIDRKGKKVKGTKWVLPEVGGIEADGITALIRAGNRLYAGVEGEVLAIDLPLSEREEPVSWRTKIDGTVSTLLAADDRLFAVTREGDIYCFGGDRKETIRHPLPETVKRSKDDTAVRTQALVETTGVRSGYAVVWGAGDGRLLAELARQTDLNLVAIEPDAGKAREVRDWLRSVGIPCKRVSVPVGDESFPLPPYLASLMIAEKFPRAGQRLTSSTVRKLFEVLRPYGGVACLGLVPGRHDEFARLVQRAELPGARVASRGNWLLLTREGGLPGAANWTHEHSDASNTRVSADRLVKAPLGILWFGGPSHDGILPRHGHGPQPQVIDGRLIIEGIDLLRCVDCYTGRILWEAKLPGLGAFYNILSHQPGANSSGTNFISTSDSIYVAYGNSCLRLDPATGRKRAEFKLPPVGGSKIAPRWGYINVAGDYLVAGADPLYDPRLGKPKKGQKTDDDDDPISKLLKKASRGSNDNLSSSKHLFVLDRHTGKVLWMIAAEVGFRHNAICAGGGRLYCIDRLSGPQLARLKRRGEQPKTKARLLCLDLKTGKERWQTDEEVFGTWLSYSAGRDILVEAGRVARDTISDEPKGMRARDGATGRSLWYQPKYTGPAMIHGDTILMAGNGCDLRTGKLKTRRDPLTGQEVEWTWTRNYGCNTPSASEHLLTFRSGAAGYYDLCNDGGTGNLGGFRSSCTNNLIVAAGLLNAPDYTRTCTCSYQNQTSLALVHMPEAEMWTFFSSKKVKGLIQRVGVNLGAPGDRRTEDGTLWVEYPSTGGPSPTLPLTTVPAKPNHVRHHSSRIEGTGLAWVASSAVKDLTRLTVDLGGDRDDPERLYTIRLHFAELEGAAAGERIFDVSLQGKTVLKDLDIVREAGGSLRPLVKEFRGVKVTKELTVSFRPVSGKQGSLLNGIEIIAEGK
jgi:outer membrane protein assembly factor BamB